MSDQLNRGVEIVELPKGGACLAINGKRMIAPPDPNGEEDGYATYRFEEPCCCAELEAAIKAELYHFVCFQEADRTHYYTVANQSGLFGFCPFCQAMYPRKIAR